MRKDYSDELPEKTMLCVKMKVDCLGFGMNDIVVSSNKNHFVLAGVVIGCLLSESPKTLSRVKSISIVTGHHGETFPLLSFRTEMNPTMEKMATKAAKIISRLSPEKLDDTDIDTVVDHIKEAIVKIKGMVVSK